MARLVSLGIVAALIVGLGMTFYQVIAPFLMPLFLGAMTALLCQPLFEYFLKRCNQKRHVASLATTSTILAAVGIPLVTAIFLGVSQLVVLTYEGLDHADNSGVHSLNLSSEVQANVESIQNNAFNWFDRYQGKTVSNFDRANLDIKPNQVENLNKNHEQLTALRRAWFDQQVRGMNQHVATALKSLASKTMGFVGHTLESTISGTISILSSLAAAIIGAVVYSLALYYFLADGPGLLIAAESLIPIEHAHQAELARRFVATVRAVVFATFLAALAQGVGTALALTIVGFDHFFALAVVATFAALIPMAGTWLVWFPYACWLGYQGHWISAGFLTVVGALVIGMLDNVIRTIVLKNDTKLHPLLAFVSVLGGLQVMGLWGVFIGPIVACCLHALIQIFNEELKALSAAELKPNPAVASISDPPSYQTLPTPTELEPNADQATRDKNTSQSAPQDTDGSKAENES